MAVENEHLLSVAPPVVERKSLVKQASSRTRRSKVKRSVSTVKKQFRFRNPVCPFIASTFLDFQVCSVLYSMHFRRTELFCYRGLSVNGLFEKKNSFELTKFWIKQAD